MEVDWKPKSSSGGEDYNLLQTESKLCNNLPIELSFDGINLLPTDDQLDQLVDNLCDTFPCSLKVKFDKDQNNNTTPRSSDSSGHESLDLAPDQTAPLINSALSPVLVRRSSVSMKNVDAPLRKKKAQTAPAKRATSNACLNMSMVKCLRYLERLTETRKSLEVHVRFQPHVLSSITRLPQSPTRVDRLIFEVDRERSKVLGLVATLDNTVQEFSATSTKDDLRCMLERFRRTIVDVIKERHNEVHAQESGTKVDNGNRATKLAQFINDVIPLIREANTALWCLKQQVLTVKSRKQCLKAACPQSMMAANIPAVEPANEAAQGSPNLTHCLVNVAAQPKSNADIGDDDGNEGRSRKKSRGEQRSAMVTGASRTNVPPTTSQSPSFPASKSKKSTMQLYAQQQRAEIFQRYASALSSTRKDSIIK